MKLTDLTLSYETAYWNSKTQEWGKRANGAQLNNLLSFNTLRNNAGDVKGSLPAMHPYRGIKGEFKQSNCFFIDIDTVDYVDYLFEHSDELFQAIPCIYAIQKSFSGKLHIVCVHNRMITDSNEWTNETKLYSIAVLMLIKRHFNIDYFAKSSDKKIPFDTNNLRWTQLFYATKNEFVVNPYCNSIRLSERDTKTIKEQFARYFKTEDDYQYTTKHVDYKLVGIDNPNVAICHLGRSQRWYLYCALISVFGDKTRVDSEFARCMRLMPEGSHSTDYYIKEAVKSDWFKSYKNKSYNTDVLAKFGYKIEQLNKQTAAIQLKHGEYLSDIQDQIEQLIEQNEYRCEIVAPTGTGKTVLINGQTEKSDIFEQIKDTTGIAVKYNAVVVVPYNMTNGLYNNLTCISSDSGLTRKENEKLISKGGPLVMVFDQFMIYSDLLVDRVVVLDEAHTIFTDKTYRESVIKFADFVVKHNMKIIAFTATPEVEADILNIPKFEIAAYRKTIKTTLVRFNSEGDTIPNAFNFEIKLIDRLKDSEKMIFFDNKNSRNLEDYIKHTRNADDITIVRADTKDNDKVVRLRETEMIETPFLVSTKAGFQGLNYKNEEKITAVISFEQMSSYKSDIFQSIGRFRKAADINAIVLYSEKDVKSVQEKIDLTEAKNKVYEDIDAENFNTVDQNALNPEQQKIMFEMESYFIENSSYQSVLDELKRHTNIKLTEKEYLCSNKRYDNQEKRAESENFIEGIRKNNWNHKTGNIFWDNNVDLMQQLTSEKITNNMITDIIATKKKNVLFETIAEELLTIINIANRGTIEEIQEYEDKLTKWVKANKKTSIDFELYKYFQHQLSLVKKTIAIKKRMVDENRDVNDFISAVIDEFLNEQTEVKTKESEAGKKGGSIGGRKSSPKKQVRDLTTGIIYDSLSDFAAAYGKSSAWASKYKDKWIKI